MNRFLFAVLFAIAAPISFSQTISSSLSGTVTDPQGASVPGALVVATEVDTNSIYRATTAGKGEWTIPSLSSGNYRVAVSLTGFQTTVVENVKLDVGTPATVNVTLTIGSTSDRIEITAGAELLQTTDASISTNLQGRQINELPMTARNGTELLIALPGTSTPGTSRTSSINGLPKGSLNLSLDGLNIQDNYLRSSDGFFATIQPKPDAVEEVSVTTAGGSADVLGQGAAQVRFVTKSGTNQFHGASFWQHRNTDLDSNYYFNNIGGIPRDRIILNQFGGSIGGPIKKNKLFFFYNHEFFRLPQSYTSALLTVPTQSAVNGVYTYQDATTKQIRTVSVYDIARNATVPAGTRAFATTPDPVVLKIVQGELNSASPSAGSLTSRVAKANDYNRNDYQFAYNGFNRRQFPTGKVDWVINDKHHVDLVINYQTYFANPDAVNSVVPILPGNGTVLGDPTSAGTRRISFSGTASIRSAWSTRLTSENRFGLNGGDSLFSPELTPAQFSQFNGYVPVTSNYFTNPYNASGTSRRNSPIKQANSNWTYITGPHVLSFGGSFTQVNLWQQSNSRQIFPSVTFGIASADPVSGIFTADSLPGSTAAQRTEASNLYAVLTGRVSAISRSVSLDEKTRTYTTTGAIDRDQQREFALFFTDNWKVTRSFTVNYGVRWDVQLPFQNLDGLYTSSGIAGAWGISGIGHLFQPGVQTGIAVPQFQPLKSGDFAYNTNYHNFNPSIGITYALPALTGWRRFLTGGKDESVFRAGYAISTIREGTNTFTSIFGSNPGRTISTAVDPSNTPAAFGAPGSVLFRDPVLPSLTQSATPSFPIAATASQSINEYDPNLRQAYVQSWSASLQRQIFNNTVLRVQYVANHAVGLWRQSNLNEVNIVENGFLNEFKIAQQNLAIAQQSNPKSTNFGYQGLPGQGQVPILTTALGTSFLSDSALATNVQRGEAGAVANAIAFNSSRMASLTKAGYPSNFFVVNPATNSGSFILRNGGSSSFNSLQVELNRRFSNGLLFGGSYVWGKSLTNMDASSSSVFNQPTTFRNANLDKGPSPWDIRHAFKLNYIYELPFGPNRHFGSSVSNKILRGAIGGWEITGQTRLQSGSPSLLRSGRQTFNTASAQSSAADAGVILHGITAQQLNDMVSIRKTGNGLVYFLPQALIDNSLAAFELGGKALTDLDPSKPYIGPPTTAGVLGDRIYLYGPWQTKVDFGIVKKFALGEKRRLEFRATALNAFNDVNFLLGSAGNDVNTLTLNSAQFGQTTSAYRDITVSGANDPGGRIVEFQARFVF